MKIHLPKAAGIACFLTAISAVTARAETVLIDFGNAASFRGASVPNPDINGNYWNSLTPGPFYSNLINTGNSPTTIDLGFSTPVGTDSFNGPAGVTSFPNPTPAEIAATDIDAAALGILGVREAAMDFAAGAGGGAVTRFEIQQLDPSMLYNLTFFGSHKFSSVDTTFYSIYTDNTYTSLVDFVSLNVQTPGSPNLHNRDRVAVLNGLSPQAGNVLYVQFNGLGNDIGYLNAMAIEVVPEPGSFLLLSAGGLWLLSARRRNDRLAMRR